jgi:hypothetical protein
VKRLVDRLRDPGPLHHIGGERSDSSNLAEGQTAILRLSQHDGLRTLSPPGLLEIAESDAGNRTRTLFRSYFRFATAVSRVANVPVGDLWN